MSRGKIVIVTIILSILLIAGGIALQFYRKNTMFGDSTKSIGYSSALGQTQ